MLKSGRSVSFNVGSSLAGTVMRVSAGIAASNTVPTSSTALATRQECGRPKNHGQASGQPGAIVTRLS